MEISFPRKETLSSMTFFELFLVALGLSMDAFAVAICKGLSVSRLHPRHAVLTGLWFGGFQAMMPAAGYLLGTRFASSITAIDHWIAFILLGLIGANMIRESFGKTDDSLDASFTPRTMLPLSVATSIDALAVGVTFAFLGVKIVPAVTFIGVITFTLSAVGVWIGNIFGCRFKNTAERAGGAVLILMGGKILLEHLGIIG